MIIFIHGRKPYNVNNVNFINKILVAIFIVGHTIIQL
jgi:hypothetical protein